MRKQRLFGMAGTGEYVAVIALTAVTLCSAQLTACKKKPPEPAAPPESSAENPEIVEAPPSAGPAPPSPGPVPTRCHERSGASPFRIGELSESKPSQPGLADADDAGPDDDDEVPAPFSVELGPARSDADGFVIGAMRSLKGQAHALIATLNADAGAGKVIDLGVVHGDPDPPSFAAHGKDLLVAVSDADAGGTMLKLGSIRDLRGAGQLVWGPEITGVRRDSTFALEVTGDRALLAYATESAGKVRVYGASLDVNDLRKKFTPEPLSAAGADAESPRLAVRKGGYWLAVARSLDAPKAKPAAHSDDGAAEPSGDDPLIDFGARRIELTKLDAQGKVASSALVVTAVGARPMSFEIAASPDGGAYVAFRADDSTPGADGGALELVQVRPDGSFAKVELSGDSNGTGTPSLLVDSSDPTRVWLAAAGENGASWFGRIGEHTTLAADSAVRGADLIAGRDGNLLLSRAHGTAAELSLVRCAD